MIDSTLGSVIGGAILIGIPLVLGLVVKVPLGDDVEVWALCLSVAAALLVGGSAAFLWTRSSGTTEGDDQQGTQELQNLKIYTANFMNILGSFLSNKLSLAELLVSDGDEKVKEELAHVICELPAELINEARGGNVTISLWAEKGTDSNRTFEVIFEGNHTVKQVKKFDKICVEHSWMHHRRESHQGDSPIQVMNLADPGDGNQDVRELRGMEYREGRVLCVEINGKPFRLVALSKQEGAFPEPEEIFLSQLWCALTIAAGLLTDLDDPLAEWADAPV